MSLDPVNYSFLSLVFPTFKLPSFQLDDRASVKILVTLVITTNLLLMISLSIVYGLYQTDKYNPWCHEDLSEFKFEEELYQHSFWFFFLLFLAASFPTLVVYFTRVLRYFLIALNVVYFDKHLGAVHSKRTTIEFQNRLWERLVQNQFKTNLSLCLINKGKLWSKNWDFN